MAVIPRVSRIAPAEAEAALRELAETEASDDLRRANAAVVKAVLDELAGVRAQVKLERTYCPHCAASLLSPVEANEHTSLCPRHPALVRMRAARIALAMAPAVADDLSLPGTLVAPAALDACIKAEAAESSPKRIQFLETDETLKERSEFVAGDGRRKYPSLLIEYAAALDVAVAVWQRIFHRDTDPCPHCGAVSQLEDAAKHALNCEHHPAVARFNETVHRLEQLLGADGALMLVEKVEERDRFVDQLRTLVKACDDFDHDMGWNGSDCYVREYQEAALGRARSSAEALVGLLPREYRPSFDPLREAAAGPEFARPVWQALLRVRETGSKPGTHRGTPSDEKLLRDAVTEGGRLEATLGSEFVCPACMRPGLWAHQMASHVPSCPFHPASLRERIIEATAILAFAVLREHRPGLDLPQVTPQTPPKIGRFWPSASTREETGVVGNDQESHLKFLLNPEDRKKYPTIVGRYADHVASSLSSWQRYRTALTGQCPYCDSSLRGFEALPHIAQCESHPAHAHRRALEEVLQRLGVQEIRGVARLQRETDLARVHIVRLAEFIDSFTGSFGDDERGRAIVRSNLLPKWNEARRIATQALEQLTAAGVSSTEGEMSANTYDTKVKDLTDLFHQDLTKDGGIFFMDVYPYCRAQVSFFSAVAEAGLVDARAADTLACETQQALNDLALENDEEGIGGHIKKMVRGLDTLRVAEAEARAIASKAALKPSRNDVYSLCSALVHHFIEK
jgi:hypothetical protein